MPVDPPLDGAGVVPTEHLKKRIHHKIRLRRPPLVGAEARNRGPILNPIVPEAGYRSPLLKFDSLRTIGSRCQNLLLKILLGIFFDQGESVLVSGVSAAEIIVESEKFGC